MIILVSMSSMKFLQKTKQKTGASKKKWAHTESFLSAPFCQGNLMYPVYIYIYILVPNVLSSSIVLVISHHCNCLGTQWNLGEIK